MKFLRYFAPLLLIPGTLSYAQTSNEAAELEQYIKDIEAQLELLKQKQNAVDGPAKAPSSEPSLAGGAPETRTAASLGLTTVPAPAVIPPNPVFKPNLPFDLEMVTMQPGMFTMGSKSSEERRSSTEGPRQDVLFDYYYEIGKYEVTFEQWDACVADGGCGGYKPDDGGWGRGKRPVINVSWDDAQLFIKWLNEKSGGEYRLPSEAEWAYAARAGTETAFYTGDTISSDDANFNAEQSYKGSEPGAYLRKTVEVGQYPPNPLGLHDVIGNAFEWVQDCWNDTHRGAPNDGSAREDGDCSYRVMKGGSWVNHPYQVRMAMRTQYVPDFRYDDYGFRLARTIK